MIEIVAQNHKKYVSIIKKFGEHFYAEDLVQETYLMLYKWSTPDKYIKDGKPNDAYIWFCLRNSFLLYQREKRKATKVSLNYIQELSQNEVNKEYFDSLEKIDTLVKNEVDSWHWYDAKMYKLHVEKKMPMRMIEAETNISLRSIFETLKVCKQRLRVAVGESYEDFINEEFERI
jgi:DNA-directed RNA polymerase specialized sigma24 family protein